METIKIPDWVKNLTKNPVLPQPERRGAPRIPLRLPSKYYSPAKASARLCYTINICETGVLLCLPEKVNVGDSLLVEIYYCFDFDLKSFEAVGKVVWVKKKKEADSKYQAALEFIEIAPADSRNLKRFLQKICY
jgi:c-di-GMP-binding flagellar brake protein YcgR